MPWPISSLGSRIRSWLRDYNCLQCVAVVLIYVQVFCSLIGSLGALFNGLQVANLVVSLFALLAIESSSQSLGRTYAGLLFFSTLLDLAWFLLFGCILWDITPDQNFEPHFVFSVKLTLWMEIIGFSARFLSLFLWIQMYRLGVSDIDNTIHRAADYNVGTSFLVPSNHEVARENSISDDVVGVLIYDQAYYSSLFEDFEDKGTLDEVEYAPGEPSQ